jgi:MFS family permease
MTESRRIIRFINIAHGIDHMFMLIFPTAVLGMGATFGKSYGELLSLSLGGFIAFGAGSLPAGWLGDVWSRRNMMAVFFIGIGLSAIMTGLCSTTVLIAVGLTFIGLFAAIYHPIGTAMLAAHAAKLGRDMGINGVWGNLGIAFAALLTGGLTQYAGWRAAFIVPGLASFIVGIAFLVMVPNLAAGKKGPPKKSPELPRAVVIRAFAVLAACAIFGSTVFNSVTIAIPKLLDERLVSFGSTPLGIGAIAACVYVFGAMSQVLIGRLLDRYTLRSVFLPLSALLAPCLYLAASSHDWAILVLMVGMMFAIFGQVTINDTMVAKYTTDKWRSRAYGVRYLMSFGASACSVPLIAYFHEGSGGFESVFKILSVFGLVVFIGALFFPHRPEEIEAGATTAKRQPS